jgi:hypothetical protein
MIIEKMLFKPNRAWNKSSLGRKILLISAAIGMLVLSSFSCTKDENPPVINDYKVPEWVQEGENIELKVNTFDDIGVREVYVQFGNESKISLTRTNSDKNKGENSEWSGSFNLPPNSYKYEIIARDTSNETKSPGSLIVFHKDADSDGLSYREEVKYGTDPDKKNPCVYYASQFIADWSEPLRLDNEG